MGENQSFIKLHRSITEWGWFHDSKTLLLFIYILLKANYEDHMFMGEVIKRGQLATSYRSLSEGTGMSIQEVRTAMSHLLKTEELTQKQHGKYSIITVQNYNWYQDNQQATNKQSTGNQHSINNNIRNKERKEIKKENISPFQEISIEEARNQ